MSFTAFGKKYTYNLLWNLGTSVVLFPLIRWSYGGSTVRVFGWLLLSQASYVVLQGIRIGLAAFGGFYIQRRLQGSVDVVDGPNLWRFLFVCLLLILYVTNQELRSCLTTVLLHFGQSASGEYEELPAFLQFVYETVISPWPWLACLVTHACFHVQAKTDL